MPSLFANPAHPAQHELIITPTPADTATETYTESTSLQGYLFTTDSDYCDLKMLERSETSTAVTSHDGTHTALQGDGKQVAKLKQYTTALKEEPHPVEYNVTDVPITYCIDADISFTNMLSRPYSPVPEQKANIEIAAIAVDSEDMCANSNEILVVSDVLYTDLVYGPNFFNHSTPREESTPASTPTTPIWSTASSPMSPTPTTPIEACDDTVVAAEADVYGPEWCLRDPQDDRDGSNVSVSSSIAAPTTAAAVGPSVAVNGETTTNITVPVTDDAGNLATKLPEFVQYPTPVSTEVPLRTASMGDCNQIVTLEQCTTAPEEEPRWVEYNENSDVPIPYWIDTDISFTDHLNRPYIPVPEHEYNIHTAATPAEVKDTCANPAEVVVASNVSSTDLLHGHLSSNTSTPTEVPTPSSLSTHESLYHTSECEGEQITNLDQCTTAPEEEPRWVEYNENSDVPVPYWIDMDISFTDHLNRPYTPPCEREPNVALQAASDADGKQIANLDLCTATDEEPRWVEYNENSDVPIPYWIDTDISFTDHLNRPYTLVHEHESNVPTAITPGEAQDKCVIPEVFASDVSFTTLLHGPRSGNNSIPSEVLTATSSPTVPLTRSSESSPISLIATTLIDGPDRCSYLPRSDRCCYNDSVSGSADTATTTTAAAGAAFAAPPMATTAGAASPKNGSYQTDTAAPVAEYHNVVFPAGHRSAIMCLSPGQDVESQDHNQVAPSRFAIRTLSRVNSVLASPFFSSPDTKDSMSDILSSFPTSIRLELISDLNNKEIFHGTCDHANPTGCGNCADKLDYLQRMRSATVAGTCNGADGKVTVAKAREIVLQVRKY
ncbi:hypothetical protein POJ06DRAFT_39489 [Lipomyces tetrasporus]|uniref:Uncharacterized protein n=1 Tax=Lipomyces tetrasporus TaxID=54092 RepID=A0AAD7QKT8_9ASCO|nr:uncharacterized protein POJ06DRAFT_39489 [Lipomyces tetrasporus]KAJ8097093.1 hypothetical protein POJ06DRAFT_39489 [Lipomyces tetrasporus]